MKERNAIRVRFMTQVDPGAELPNNGVDVAVQEEVAQLEIQGDIQGDEANIQVDVPVDEAELEIPMAPNDEPGEPLVFPEVPNTPPALRRNVDANPTPRRSARRKTRTALLLYG